MVSDGIRFEIGFLIDGLTALMMVVVTGVSLAVHVYTIGYMHDDPGYQRFFSYISLFTFAMLMLVMSNNFLQLFFGWEAVGLVSYLLIGFWYKKRDTAIYANLKAFLVNRVGDFGFLLGIAVVLMYTGSLDYYEVFERADAMLGRTATMQVIPGRRLVGDHDGLHPVVHRRHGQVGAGAAARVAARLDGRPDADLGADPRRDHGDRRYLHGGADVAAVRTVDHRAVGGHRHRRDHRFFHGACRHRAKRYQARGGLLDPVAARLHVRGARRLGLLGGDLPPDDARVLQGACCSSPPVR